MTLILRFAFATAYFLNEMMAKKHILTFMKMNVKTSMKMKTPLAGGDFLWKLHVCTDTAHVSFLSLFYASGDC